MTRLTRGQVFAGLLFAALMVLGYVSLVSAATATAPKPDWVSIWEPWHWELGQSPGDKLIQRVVTESQGFSATGTRYQLTSANRTAGSVGGCDRMMYDALEYGSGITLVHSHGGPTPINANNTHKTTVDNWRTAGTGDANVGATTWWADKSSYYCQPNEAWYTDNWKDGHDDNAAIVHLAMCSATASKAAAMGGRIAFGYTGTTDATKDTQDIDKLYGRMNGKLSSKERRIAGEALAPADFNTGFGKVTGDANTTLCPAPLKPADNPWGPIGAGAGASGSGWIELDTHCDDTKDPNQALTFVTTGDVTISNIRWVNDHKLAFDYSSSCAGSDYTVTVTAHANKIIAKDGISYTGGGRYMDGNREASSGDDVVWSFAD